MAKVSIVGAYNTQFGQFVDIEKQVDENGKKNYIYHDKKSFYELLNEAAQGAVKDAGIDPKDVDGIWVGSCSPALFVGQEHIGPLALEAFPKEWRFKPSQRVEGACASSSLAIYNAMYAIESGRIDTAVVIGVEKMNLLNTKLMTAALAGSSYMPEEGSKGMSFPMLFAEYAKGYMKHYDISEDELKKMLAHVAGLCYSNGIKNPLAHFGPGSFIEKKGLTTAQAILDMPDEGKGANVMVAYPLRLHDCSLVSDGAAAVVLTKADNAKSINDKVVDMAGIAAVTERMPESVRPNMHELIAGKEAIKQAFDEAKITIKDVDLVELHDCFTINQLTSTEALGLSEDGKAGYDYMEGKFTAEDDTPINLSGGLKAKGHPVGATGASMHALIYKQLVGDPIGLAPAKGQPEIGVTFNVGGSAVTNCVSVLKRR